METYPYPTPDGIIDLVRKSEFDRLKWDLEEQKAKYTTDVAELNERLTKQQSDMLDTIVGLRSELTRWQSLAGQMAEALGRCTTKSWFASDDTGEVIVALDAGKVRAALAAYEAAKKGELPDLLAEAVKRMESVTNEELNKVHWGGQGAVNSFEANNRVRARLIQAVKGEQP